MKYLMWGFIRLIVFSALSFGAWSQTTPITAPSKPPSKSLVKAKQPSANKAMEILPYKAVRVSEYLDKLKINTKVMPRGEFEAKEAYEERISHIFSFPPSYVLINKQQFDNYYYNIDEKILELYVDTKNTKSLNGIPLLVDTVVTNLGKYQVSNIFGAIFEVKKTHLTDYVLYVDQPEISKMIETYWIPSLKSEWEPILNKLTGELYDRYTHIGLVIRLNIEPSDAEQLVKNYQIFMKVVPNGTVNYKALSVSKPSFKDPYEASSGLISAQVKVEEIIVRNMSNGHEVRKFTFQ